MKVEELIKRLKNAPQDAEVYLTDENLVALGEADEVALDASGDVLLLMRERTILITNIFHS